MRKEEIMLTGNRSTGRLHIGHYMGSLKRRVKLQGLGLSGKTFIFTTDVQTLTSSIGNPGKVRRSIIEIVPDYLARGLGPERSTIFIQSQIPELYELMSYYMDLVTISHLQRNPIIRMEIRVRNFGTNIPIGFFTHPTSQAADIIALHTTIVPVGEDQELMIERIREIIRRFDYIYGETLVEPEVLPPNNAACLRLPGTDGKTKVNKSLGNCIYLSEGADKVQKRVVSMFTDPDHLRVQDPGGIEGSTVPAYLNAFCHPEHFGRYLPDYPSLGKLKAHYQRGGSRDIKAERFLNAIVQEELELARNRRKGSEKDIPAIYEMLREGCGVARAAVIDTLSDVRKAMKINYFDDVELTNRQIKRSNK